MLAAVPVELPPVTVVPCARAIARALSSEDLKAILVYVAPETPWMFADPDLSAWSIR